MKKALLVLALILIFSSITMAETYRIGGTTAGNGFEYRTDKGIGYSVGTIWKPETNNYYIGVGIRKMAKNGAYIGAAYGLGLEAFKVELGYQFRLGSHFAVSPGLNFWYDFEEIETLPGLGLALEF